MTTTPVPPQGVSLAQDGEAGDDIVAAPPEGPIRSRGKPKRSIRPSPITWVKPDFQ